jgi:hypothetical protein
LKKEYILEELKQSRLFALYTACLRWSTVLLLSLLIVVSLITASFLLFKDRTLVYALDMLIFLAACVAGVVIYKLGQKYIPGKRVFQALLLLGIVLRIFVFVHDLHDRPKPESDYAKHEILARRLAFEHEYYDSPTPTGTEIRARRPPGLPLIMAVFYKMGTDQAPLIAMTLFQMGVLLAAYLLLMPHQNVLALLLFAYLSISPNILSMASTSNSQLPHLCLILMLLLVLQFFRGRYWESFLVGLLLGVDALVRLNIFLLLPGLLIFIVAYYGPNKQAAVKSCLVIAVALIVTILPWTYRNYRVLGHLVVVSETAGTSMHSANVITDPKRGGGYNEISEEFWVQHPGLSEIELNRTLQRETIDYIRKNPSIYLKSVPYRLARFMGMQGWSIQYFFTNVRSQYPEWVTFLTLKAERFLIWVVFISGFIWVLTKRKILPLQAFVLFAYVSYVVIDLALFETGERYHFPYILFPLLAAALSRDLTRKPAQRLDAR